MLEGTGAEEQAARQSDSNHVPLSSLCPRLANAAFAPEVPAAHPLPACVGLASETVVSARSPPRPPPTASPRIPAVLAGGGTKSIPLQLPQEGGSISAFHVGNIVPLLAASIDMSVAIIHMHIATTEAIESQAKSRKMKKRRLDDALALRAHTAWGGHSADGGTWHHTHAQEVFNLLACHIGIEAAKWYIKPKSTCWFEEYLFKIYTPDMFYDILWMRRATFDRLVNDLRPFIQGQPTHWRQPIKVEKKVVVTLFKLMHGVCIPLVADRAALEKSTVHGISRQVCFAISNNFGHLIAWPAGRRLARVTSAFQAKQHLLNCIGAIDGSHVYIAAPPNSIVAADHRNR